VQQRAPWWCYVPPVTLAALVVLVVGVVVAGQMGRKGVIDTLSRLFVADLVCYVVSAVYVRRRTRHHHQPPA